MLKQFINLMQACKCIGIKNVCVCGGGGGGAIEKYPIRAHEQSHQLLGYTDKINVAEVTSCKVKIQIRCSTLFLLPTIFSASDYQMVP